MGTLIALLKLLLLHTVTSAQLCPHGSVSSKDNSRCFNFISSKTDFIMADRTCRGTGGNLASILTNDDQRVISELLRGEEKRGVDVWIGGNDIFHYGNWSWTDGKPFEFLSNPAPTATGHCLSLVAATMWTKAKCCSKKSFVCATVLAEPAVTQTPTTSAPTTTKSFVVPQLPCAKSHCISKCKCRHGWTLFQGNNMCYKFVDSLQFNWTEAVVYCEETFGHLVSILSQKEQNFLENLVGSTNQDTPRTQDTWIGLWNWWPRLMFYWADACIVDYTNWAVNQPYSGPNLGCVKMNAGNNTRTWSVALCDERRNFICKRQPI
ncbi:hypothetical protein L596_010521 [Steinernema carpocapsae]|uniref:C-type lectin domain-containing protein n=1 Tax=Steinernema carpocapsae TaxID=34508 RepID=A0A4U5PJ57_STECR|nr:hypothetical protein L596_010521 [Steinernema carpocapsae]